MATTKVLAEDIPTTTAWQTGRRLYIRCGYQSRLNAVLRDLGAHWDREQRALWIGSTKREAVLDAVRAHEARRTEYENAKAVGHWVQVPYEAHEVRARAKALKGLYGGKDHPGWWSLPTEEARAEIKALLQGHIAAQKRARKEDTADQQAAEAAVAQARRERLLEDSGRCPTGDTAELREISTQVMSRATALNQARGLGDLVRLSDGRRGIVTGVRAWFTGDDAASSVCWHDETHDAAHWDFAYTVAVVEPTDEEAARDTRAVEEARDAADIGTLIQEVSSLPVTRGGWSSIPDADKAGSVNVSRGITSFHDGTLILTHNGRVVWQHPGYYEDYLRTERESTDPDLVERARSLIASGSRSRTQPGMQVAHYDVSASSDRDTRRS